MVQSPTRAMTSTVPPRASTYPRIAPYATGAFALCAVLSMLLPRTAVSEEAATDS